jgi:hypothetical protein
VPREVFVDEEGSVLFDGEPAIALLDDRDLLRFADQARALQRIKRGEVPRRFSYAQEPQPG